MPLPPGATVMTVAEVSDRLRVHRATVIRYISDGEFPGVFRTKGAWRIPVVDVDHYETQHRP